MRTKHFSIAALVSGALIVGMVAPAAGAFANYGPETPSENKITGGKVTSYYDDFIGVQPDNYITKVTLYTYNNKGGYYNNTLAPEARLHIKCEVTVGDVTKTVEYAEDFVTTVGEFVVFNDAEFRPCDTIKEVNVKAVPGDLDGDGGINGVRKSQRDEDDLMMAVDNLDTAKSGRAPLRIIISTL